jgi:5-methylcytosine-specific restriction endonuclease McrA
MAVIAPQTEQTQTSRVAAQAEATDQTQTVQATQAEPDQAGAQGLFALLDAADRALEAVDPSCLSVEDGTRVLRRVARHERRVLAYKTGLSARLAEGSHYTRTGHHSAAELVAAATGDSVGEAKDLIRLGEALVDQPELAESFRAGKLSRRRAARVSDAVKVNPAREAELVSTAESDSEATLKERCHRAKVEGRSSEAEARHFQKLREDRRCRTFTDDDGAFRLQAVLAPEAGAGVLAALEAETDRRFTKARAEGRFETTDAYRADALVALLTGQGILGPGGDGKDPAPSGRSSDPKATVSVVVDLEALRRGSVAEGERCEIPGVGPVGVDYARELLGEALVEVLIAKGTDVTTVSSAGRHIPKPLRSALLLRDPRCVVPGCDARLGLENDHWVTDFAKGGLTALDNLARICRRHHQDRTHHGFELTRTTDAWVWTAPERPMTPKRRRPKRRPRAKAPPQGTGPPLFDQPPLDPPLLDRRE